MAFLLTRKSIVLAAMKVISPTHENTEGQEDEQVGVGEEIDELTDRIVG